MNPTYNPNQQFAPAPATQWQQPQQPQFGQQMPQQGFAPAPASNMPAQQATFNLTDPSFLDSAVNYDADIDANISTPPVLPSEFAGNDPNFTYTVTAEFAQGWQGAVVTKGANMGAKYAKCTLLLTIENCTQRPTMNGRKLRYDVSTLLYSSSPVSKAQGVIQAAGWTPQLKQAPKTQKSLMDLVTSIVQQKVRMHCTVDWEARMWDKERQQEVWSVRGWRNFPIDPNSGEPVPTITKQLVLNGAPVTDTRNAQMVVRLVSQKGTQAQAQPSISFAPQGAMAPQAQQPMQQPVQPQYQQAPQQTQQPQQPMQMQPQYTQPQAQPLQASQVAPQPQPTFAPPAAQQYNAQAAPVQAPPVIFNS